MSGASKPDGDLAEKLAILAERRRAALPDAYARILDPLVEHLRMIGMAETTLKVGDRLPSFLLPDARGRLVSSDDLLKRGPLAVGFFRGGWCPYCHVALEALSAVHPDIIATGGTIVAVTPDLIPANEDVIRSIDLPFEILSDVDSALGLQCGIIYRMPPGVIELYSPVGLARRQGTDSYLLPIPAVFVADRSATIRYAFADPDFRLRAEPQDIIRALAALSR